MAPQLTYDGITSLEDFLHELAYDNHSLNRGPSQWIEAVCCRLEGEALEWANNEERVVRIRYYAYYDDATVDDADRLNQLFEDRFVASLSYRASILMGVKQEHHESIEDYYVRVNTIFRHVGGQDRVIGQYSDLDYEQSCCLVDTLNWFVAGLRNIKLRSQMLEEFWVMHRQNRVIDISLQSICTAAQLKYTIMKFRRRFQANDQSLVTLQVNAAIVGNINVESVKDIFAFGLWMSPLPPVDISIVNESPFIQKENTCNLSESCNADITNTAGKFVASELVDWSIFISMQKSSFETGIVYESSPVLVQIRSDLSEISTNIENSSDIEAIDEILAFGPSKWPAPITTLPEIIAVYESPPVLEKMSCDLSEISTDIEDSSDIESIDEIFASGLHK